MDQQIRRQQQIDTIKELQHTKFSKADKKGKKIRQQRKEKGFTIQSRLPEPYSRRHRIPLGFQQALCPLSLSPIFLTLCTDQSALQPPAKLISCHHLKISKEKRKTLSLVSEKMKTQKWRKQENFKFILFFCVFLAAKQVKEWYLMEGVERDSSTWLLLLSTKAGAKVPSTLLYVWVKRHRIYGEW